MAQARREAKYPEEVSARAAEVFVRHEFADLPVEVAHHALGVTRRRLLRHPPRAHHGVDDAGAGRGVALKRVAQPSMTVRATVTSVNEWRVEFANQVMSADNRATLHVDQRRPAAERCAAPSQW